MTVEPVTPRYLIMALIDVAADAASIEMLLRCSMLAEHNGFFHSYRTLAAYVQGDTAKGEEPEPLSAASIAALQEMRAAGSNGIMVQIDGEREGLHIFEDIAKSYPDRSFDCAMLAPDGTETFAHYGAYNTGAPRWNG